MRRVTVLLLAQVLVWPAWIKAEEIENPGAEKDGWGPWGELSVCSRSCGVGVSYQERECQSRSEHGPTCSGENRIYQTCSIQDCPEGSRDFRLEQCARFNDHDYRGKRYRWVPYIVAHEACVLNCMPKGHHFYNRWTESVIDGTKCGSDPYHICVNGKCERLGCDLILGSNAREDKCGVCSGRGENCRTVRGSCREDGHGYKEITIIPAGSTNIEINEIKPAHSYLALMSSKGSYYLNGGYNINNPGSYKIGGSIFTYERNGEQERILCKGPTTVPVYAMVLLLGHTSGSDISYEFSVPTAIIQLLKQEQFSWKTGEFGKCSKSCAGGEHKRRVYCVQDRNSEGVADYKCDGENKPSYREKCNTQPCPARWFISGWSDCSVTCSRGKHVRRVHCEHIVDGGDSAMIPDDQCPGPKPSTMQACHTNRECPVWSAGEWTRCSATCGMGRRSRNVSCLIVKTSESLPDENCSPSRKPDVNRDCTRGPCTVKWSTSNWSECYPSCGRGMATRMVYCVSVSDEKQKYSDQLCNLKTLPESRKECYSRAECPPMWHASEWSRCTAKCGVGMQMRNVMCAHKEGEKILRILPEQQCNNTTRMNSIQKCTVRPCQANWLIHRWSECSATCGAGVRRRKVKCITDSRIDEEEKWCFKGNKPRTQEQCVSAFTCKDSVPVAPENTSAIPTTEGGVPSLETTVAATSPKEITERQQSTSTTTSTTFSPPTTEPTTVEQSTQLPQTTTEQTTETQIPKTAEQSTEIQIPTTTAQQSTETQIPTTTEQTTETQIPTTTAVQSTEIQIPTTTAQQSTETQIPTTTVEQSAETQIPTTTEQTTETQTPTITAEQSTETQIPTTTAEQSTETQIPTTTAEQSTETQTPTTTAEQSTETQIPTTTAEQSTETQTPTTTVEQSTETQIPTTAEQSTETQIPTTTVEQSTETQTPTTTAEQSTETQIPTTTVEQSTETQTPTITAEQSTETQIPTTTAEQSTESQIPTTTVEQSTETQIPTTTAEQSTETQIPTTTVEQSTETQTPTITAEQSTETQIPTTTAEQSTESQIPTTTVEQSTETQIPTTTAEQSTETQIPTTTAQQSTESQIPITEQTTESQIPTTVEQSTETQIPTTTEQTTETQIPTTTAVQSTDTQIPTRTAQQSTETQLPKTTTEQSTDTLQSTVTPIPTTTEQTIETEIATTAPTTETPKGTHELTATAAPKTVDPSMEMETTVASMTIDVSTQSPNTITKQTTGRRPVPAKIHLAPTDTVAYAKTEVVFTCAATGYPTPVISWRKGSLPVSSLGPHYELLSHGSLRIRGVALNDEDKYTCIATNFVGPMDMKNTKLTVVVRPSVRVSRNATVQEGAPITITCRFSGKPYPTSKWFKDGVLVDQNNKRMAVEQTKLTIRQIIPSDNGRYSCQAAHKYDRAEDSMYLTVNRNKGPTTVPCIDNEAVAQCSLVKMVGLCCNPFYQQACCITCSPMELDCSSTPAYRT